MLRTSPPPAFRQTSFNLDIFRPQPETAPPRLVFNPRRSLPAYSLLVGACDDGRPLLLDLLYPTTGPVLVAGDRGCGKTALLQSVCRSAAELNGPAEVHLSVITSRPEEWRSFKSLPVYVLPATDHRAVERLLLELSVLYEQRREGDLAGPASLLLIDELPDLLSLDLGIQVELHALLGCGAAARIWSFAAVDTSPALNLHYWINLFHTRLIGSIASTAALRELARYPGLVRQQAAGARFAYWDRSTWCSFWVQPS